MERFFPFFLVDSIDRPARGAGEEYPMSVCGRDGRPAGGLGRVEGKAVEGPASAEGDGRSNGMKSRSMSSVELSGDLVGGDGGGGDMGGGGGGG